MNEDFDLESMYEDRFMDDTDNEPMEYEDDDLEDDDLPWNPLNESEARWFRSLD